jgi:excisionase family DNA binding protein
MSDQPRPDQSPLALRPAEAARALGVSRSRLYELLAQGELKARKLGASTLIERVEIERYIETLPAYEPAAAS